jgi:hypothetical protein
MELNIFYGLLVFSIYKAIVMTRESRSDENEWREIKYKKYGKLWEHQTSK